MFVSDLVFEFLESLEVENGRSRYTARDCGLYLSRVKEFGGDELNPE